MRLVFVHGINNQSNTVESIAQDWWQAIERGWHAAGLVAKPKPPITAAYYADLLAGETRSAAVEMGVGTQSTGLAVGLLQEYAGEADITADEMRLAAIDLGIEPEAVEQGIPHDGRIVRFASVLERVLPTKGKLLARFFLRQAVTYISDKALARRIDRTVARQIFADDSASEPVIVVAHSLGTVVSYRILADRPGGSPDVPLFLTLGSPLSVQMFKAILPVRGSIPNPPIGQWFNARHLEDFVTLGRPITEESIGFSGVIDCTGIINDDSDKHEVVRYLASPDVARKIHEIL